MPVASILIFDETAVQNRKLISDGLPFINQLVTMIAIARYVNQDITERKAIEDRIKQADLVMCEAKAAGRDTLCFFEPKK